ncbi:MAG: GNAT family N-acetyltransferase [Dehalococcoidales bacterium]|nr:GNAT family N-acetyltransferase [Dehalococcoidales bacterium]
MEPDIRAARPEEMEEFARCARTGFGLPGDFNINLKPEWTLCAFAGSKLATSYAAWPLTMYFGETQVPVAGVTMVSTFPVYRRNNYLRKVTEAHFSHLHERQEQSITALLPSMAAIYQRYGYGVVSSRNRYSIEPRQVRFAFDLPESGDFHEAGDKELGTMLELYRHFASTKIGYLRRGERMQVAPGAVFNVLNSMPPALPAVRLIFRQAGKPQGYIIYSITRDASRDPMGQKLMIQDLVWLTPAAYHSIWRLLSNMDLVSSIEWGKVPPDDPLPHLLLEPRKINITSADGLMARIVDIESALPQRIYNGEADLTFEVIDDLCEWNRGTWKMSISPYGNQVARTALEAQIRMPVSTLAMLIFGQISASRAAAMGRLDEIIPGSAYLWDGVMRTSSPPFCADIF